LLSFDASLLQTAAQFMANSDNLLWKNFENLRVSKNASNVQRMPRLYNRVVCTNFDIYVFITLTSAGGLLIPEGVIRPVVSVSALTWFIRYIYY
jgi:4-hydroxy-3-methylbut-2-en-1-yl diphosphate synthase IspG/GcpE